MCHSYNNSLHWYVRLVAVATFLLILAGGLVTSNDAGLAVPDWPLSFGQVMPEMVGGVFYEHGHRMIASTVGFLTMILAFWLAWSETRRWVRRLGWLALVAVIVQGLLGGLTVLLLLPPAVSVLHACLAQTFLCLVVTLVVVTSEKWQGSLFPVKSHFDQPGFRPAVLICGSIFVQLVLGAIVRHSGMVGGSKGAELIPAALVVHILGAVLVIGVLIYGVMTISQQATIRAAVRLTNLLFGLLAVQLMLGVGAFLVRLKIPTRAMPLPSHVAVTTAHVGVGALMLVTSLVIVLVLTQQSRKGRTGDLASAVQAGGLS